MKRAAIVVVIVAALATLGSNAPSDAQAPPAFESSWCDSPVAVPLAVADATSTRSAEGVATARGAQAALSSLGPVVRMEEFGSRVQVTLGQTLFHTQWLFAGVGADDSVRVDARLGQASQPIDASSIRGALTKSTETDGRGLVAVATGAIQSTGDISVFDAATEFLFTNEGAGPIDLVAAVGCPALSLQSSVLTTPTWDPTTQRFLAEHEVTFTNEIVNPKTRALRVLNPAASDTIVDDLTIEVAVAAEGFARAEIVEIDMSESLRQRWNQDFDGVDETGLLSVPLRLSDGDPRQLQFTVAYEPDFDDPSWLEGVDAPAPVVRLRGEVDDVAVGLSAVLRREGAEVDSEVEPNRLTTPEPGIVVDHTFVEEPTSSADGLVSMTERLTVTNAGETALTDLVVEFAHVDMYGAGSQLIDFTGSGIGRCGAAVPSTFNGASRPAVIVLPEGLDVASTCTVELRSTILPGIVPSPEGTDYEGAAFASARSGLRDVRDVRAVHVGLAQVPEIGLDTTEPVITNLRDGRYQIDGAITVTNIGDQNLQNVRSGISIAAAQAGELRPAAVSVDSLSGSETCGVRPSPSRTVETVGLSSNATLAVGDSCTMSFVLIARPGALLDGWTIEATARGDSPRRVDVVGAPIIGKFDLPESPAVEVTIESSDLTNNADGTYTLQFDTVIVNSGDTPLVEVVVPDAASEVFGESLVRSTLTLDSCRNVTWRRSLASTSPASSCEVSRIVTVEPGTALTGWTMTAGAEAASTSGARVSGEASAPPIDFTERPSMRPTMSLDSVESLADGRFVFVLDGSIENTGDIELRDLEVSVDLSDTFGSVPFQVVDASSRILRLDGEFDGDTNLALLGADNTVPIDETVSWTLVVIAETDTEFGPFSFEAAATASSPGGRSLGPSVVSDTRALPLAQIVDRSLTASNNNDGTYVVEHRVSARNAGGVPLAGISVESSFDRLFRSMLVDDPVVESSCDATVPVGGACSMVERGVVRPGASVGPYEVDVSISSADDAQVAAFVIAPPSSILFESEALAPLWFEESPSISLVGDAEPAVNNGDGTYTTNYSFAVENVGDVPLYSVTGADPIDVTFGDVLVENQILVDECAAISFGQPLAPGEVCVREHAAVVRPAAALGPWVVVADVTANTPTFATVADTIELEPMTFTETVALDAESSLVATSNNGDGTYLVDHDLVVTNTGDVPIVDLSLSDTSAVLGDRLLGERRTVDACTEVSARRALAPGASCQVHLELRMLPGTDLGPFMLDSEVVGTSPSGAETQLVETTGALTLTEAPEFSLASEVMSVESTDDHTLRVIVDLTMENSGDVRLDDVQLELDLLELFPDGDFRIDGLLSNDLEIDEAFTAGDSIGMLVPGQRLVVDESVVVTLIVSITPGANVGPFSGDLRAHGTSPASQRVTAVVRSKIDLPSVSIDTVAQSIDNNRDGSYTVNTTYEITNDGSTPLEFVRLVEDLDVAYPGVPARLVAARSDDVRLVDLDDDQRGSDVLDWGVELGVAESAVVTTSVLVTPGNVLGPFSPAAQTRAASPTGTEVVAELTTAPAIEFVERPDLRIEQELLGRPVWNAAGTFDVSLQIELINDGDVELRNMQVNQDLLRALGEGARIDVHDVRSDDLSVNALFDGLGQLPADPTADLDEVDEVERRDVGDTRLLLGGDTLAAGARATIELDMTITPEVRGVYSTRTIVSGWTPGGAGLGSSGDEIEANTLTRLSVEGELGVAKQVIGEPSIRPDGGIAVTYEILVENAGPFPLSNVQVHDQLSQAFGTGATFVTSRVRIEEASPCSGHASASYDGGAVDPVLVSGVELEPGERCRLQYDAVVVPSKALPGPFRSSAFAIGSDPFSGIVIDDSTDGTNIDPDGNQEPGDNDIATAVRVEVPEPAVLLDVEVAEVDAPAASSWFDVTLEVVITNVGPIDIDSTQMIADLDATFAGDFDVVSVTSDELVVDDAYDGNDRSNLLVRRNTVRSGESASLLLHVRAARSSVDLIETDFALTATSVTGTTVEAVPAIPAIIDLTDLPWVQSGNLISRLSVEEQRLLALGASAFVLFFVLFIRRAMNWLRIVREERSRRRAGPGPIDLRSTIDLRGRPQTSSHGSSDQSDRHHSPRRRRDQGRRVDH